MSIWVWHTWAASQGAAAQEENSISCTRKSIRLGDDPWQDLTCAKLCALVLRADLHTMVPEKLSLLPYLCSLIRTWRQCQDHSSLLS